MSIEVEHEIDVAAPAVDVYRLVAGVEDWPEIFGPTVHVECVERTGRTERIRIWATANETVKTWTSRRELDPDGLRIGFRQEISQPPVAAMGGAWIIEPVGDARCRVRLLHDYRAVDDDVAALAWIGAAVDRNSTAELRALKERAEASAADDLLLTFEDAIEIAGPAAEVYHFIYDAAAWPERLPHVARVTLTEETPGLQLLEMDTSAPDGTVHTTTSVRVCRPYDKIVYKQIRPPRLMTVHTGQWLFEERAETLWVTSRHMVRINPANIAAVLGDGCGVPEARAFVRHALGANSLATLSHAKAHAESWRV
jgi:aromatase